MIYINTARMVIDHIDLYEFALLQLFIRDCKLDFFKAS